MRLPTTTLVKSTARAFGAATLLSAAVSHAASGTLDADALVELSFDELLNVEITSVSKKAERLQDAPAAVFVISADDLRRSGARSIPDALRMVPGVQVAQVDANKWAVTARGFNGRFAARPVPPATDEMTPAARLPAPPLTLKPPIEMLP